MLKILSLSLVSLSRFVSHTTTNRNDAVAIGDDATRRTTLSTSTDVSIRRRQGTSLIEACFLQLIARFCVPDHERRERAKANRLQAAKFGVTSERWPALTLLDMSAFTHYVHDANSGDGALDYDAVVRLCDGYLSGTRAPNVRKQPPPADGLARPVRQLVYDTFQSVVFDPSLNVLVAFCRPDEPACQVLDRLLVRGLAVCNSCAMSRCFCVVRRYQPVFSRDDRIICF
jgi:hypothetical protein